jgi:hypothetical protein
MPTILLRHYWFSRHVSRLHLRDDRLEIEMPHMFKDNQRVSVPLADIAIADTKSLRSSAEQQTGWAFARPLVIAYFATTTPMVNPNIVLFFRTPQRIPQLRGWAHTYVTGASSSDMTSGLDGLQLRAANVGATVAALVRAGAEPTVRPNDWMRQTRETRLTTRA